MSTKPAVTWDKSKTQDVCIWMQGSDGPWYASCGVIWEFVDGGPAENGAHFCHHCGGVLMADPFVDDDLGKRYAAGDSEK